MSARTIATQLFLVSFFTITIGFSTLAPARTAFATDDASSIVPVDRPYDHLRCYKIQDPKRYGALVDLLPLQHPPFPVERGCRVRIKAREFCIPVHKRLGPVLTPDLAAIDLRGQDLVNDFLCYKVRCPEQDLPNGWPVADQFGRRVVGDFQPKRICTPARKLPVQQRCCDPREEPGTGGIPLCVEGATCCNDGVWRCNAGDGTSTCPIDEGRVCGRCCNPAEEPGVDGSPLCIEGHTCCANGRWQCNEANGSSSCAIDGVVCDDCCPRSAKPGAGGSPPCIEGATCCSTGQWRCNSGNGSSTCGLDGQACDCCDPRREPGVGGNPICIEGHSCCANGSWQCNGASGQSTCQFSGERCPDTCGGIQGIPCDDGEYCMFEEGRCCCDLVGKCKPIPGACTDDYDPVCGCDGVTYSNACQAAGAGMNVSHRGPCEVCGGISGIECPNDKFCQLDVGQCCCDFQGKCTERPEVCPANVDPVCGCDGTTYTNACEAARARVSVDRLGPCENSSVTE